MGSALDNFTFGKNETQAVACLNNMVADALQHLPYCIEYLSTIRDEQNFLFCAIPQVMAAHTLSLCYANPNIFKGEIRKNLGECRNTQPVKIRKGLSARLGGVSGIVAFAVGVVLVAVLVMALVIQAKKRAARGRRPIETARLTKDQEKGKALELGPYASDADDEKNEKLGCYESNNESGEEAEPKAGSLNVDSTPSTMSCIKRSI